MSFFSRVHRHVPASLLWAGMAACAAGLGVHRLWEALPFPRFFEHALLALLALVAAWPLQRWLGWSLAAALSALWLLALCVFAGPVPMLAVAMLAAAAIAIGSLVMAGPVALVLGLALIAGTLGWLLPWPIHHRAVYALACIGLIAWRRTAIADACRSAWRHFDDAARAAPIASTAAILLLGLASTGAWLPTMQYDDVVYHLGLPWQLQETARYAMDPNLQVWALAPWAGDVLQGVAQVLAGTEARGALDGLWLGISAAAAFALVGALGGDARRRWWAVALLGSLPMSMHLAAGMQTELPAMALLPALAWLVLRDNAASGARALFAGAILFGALWGFKLMHGVVALPLLAWAWWRHRAAIPWRWLPLAMLVTFAIGASSYLTAWSIAGNPLLPLLNATFRSPYFAVRDLDDPRWRAGLDVDVLWDISFDTEHYLESFDGGFGFALVALAGVWLLALRDARTRGLALVAGAAVLLPLLPLQYARYLQPGLALAIPALVVAYPLARGANAAFWALCMLNLAFATNANWMLRTGALKYTIAAAGRDAPLLERYLPERILAARLRAAGNHAGTVLLLPGSSIALAELGQRGRNMLWYSPRWEAAGIEADADPSGRAWAHLLHANRIAHVLLRPATLTPAQRAGLQRSGAALAATAGDAQWWRIPDNAPP
ncbi:hypothetical protein [Thermomonas aquatica]|uniref:hypothetical protein n=1 Tax=Thermomonas aquatica TaxID=2202149 RepID=UPI00143CF712|nr:hypothetical protein [Thermomonas aquatica]